MCADVAGEDREHVFLIDGSGFIFRAYFAGIASRQGQMSRSDGTPTNAVYIYTRMMLKLIEDTEADYVAVSYTHLTLPTSDLV